MSRRAQCAGLLRAGCRWVLVKEGAEARDAPARQDADRDAQPVRRGGSYSSQLDMATGLSGEGSRLHELVLL